MILNNLLIFKLLYYFNVQLPSGTSIDIVTDWLTQNIAGVFKGLKFCEKIKDLTI